MMSIGRRQVFSPVVFAIKVTFRFSLIDLPISANRQASPHFRRYYLLGTDYARVAEEAGVLDSKFYRKFSASMVYRRALGTIVFV